MANIGFLLKPNLDPIRHKSVTCL